MPLRPAIAGRGFYVSEKHGVFILPRRQNAKKRRAAVIFCGRGEYIKTVGRGDKNLLTGFDIVSVKTIKFKGREKV